MMSHSWKHPAWWMHKDHWKHVLNMANLWSTRHHLLYPGIRLPEPAEGLGDVILKRPDVSLRGWVERPGQSDALVVFGGNNMPLSLFRSFFKDCTEKTVYLVPYRGFEGQAGTPSEPALVGDAKALLEHVRRRHSGSVAVLGISLGTGVAMQAVHTCQSDIERLLLVTPYDSILNVAKHHFLGFPVERMLKDWYESFKLAPTLNIPTLVMRSALDEVVPPDSTDRLLEAFGNPLPVLSAPLTHSQWWYEPWIHQTRTFMNAWLDGPIPKPEVFHVSEPDVPREVSWSQAVWSSGLKW